MNSFCYYYLVVLLPGLRSIGFLAGWLTEGSRSPTKHKNVGFRSVAGWLCQHQTRSTNLPMNQLIREMISVRSFLIQYFQYRNCHGASAGGGISDMFARIQQGAYLSFV